MINLTATSSSSYNAQLVISDAKSESSIEIAESANISITSVDGKGVTVSLSESSQSYFHQSKVQAPEIVAPIEEPAEQSAAQTAQNIIEPVREKLSEAQDAGADRKELRGLLRDASRGFRQGFREAVKTIRHSGNMDPELRNELRETRQLVRQGFKALRQEFLPRPQDSSVISVNAEGSEPTTTRQITTPVAEPDTQKPDTKTATNSPVAVQSADDSNNLEVNTEDNSPAPIADSVELSPAEEQSVTTSAPESLAARNSEPGLKQVSNFNQSIASANRNAYAELQNLAQSVSASYDRSQSAVIEITTQDGDTISIDIASAIKASKTLGENGDFEFSLQGQNTDSIVIEGELDADELKALNSVLDQVNELASMFFDGDVAAAFEEAMNIGLDPAEIASFSLSLNQSTTIEASRAYLQNDGSEGANEQLQKQSRLLSLGDYVTQMQKTMETASKFSNAANMVEKLLDKEALLHHDSQPKQNRDLFNQLNENILSHFDVSR